MKILIVTNMFPSKNDVSWRGGFVKDQVDAYQEKFPSAQIDIHHIKAKISGGTNLSYFKALLAISYKAIFGKYDVIHSHHAFCTLLCLLGKRKLIYTVHEGELNNKKIRSSLIKLAIKLANTVIYVSQSEFRKSKKNKKYFLPCGVDHLVFCPSPNKESVKSQLDIPLEKKVILFPADPNRPEKNANILKSVENSIKPKNENLLFIYGGKIDKSDMSKYMQASEIVVSIGQFESDGMVIKEAISCNAPVLATNVGNAELYINPKNGLLVDATPHSITEAISKLLSNNQLYRHGREHLLMLGQDMERVSESLNTIYSSVSAKK
ncbi:glycosyltransferase family 4 protein [Pseudomonas vancouverensis]|uniref:glycosyltransferase family 4 protein n=1 Tax=Pseudomonas vancouverensis TaxID=95300 RepID=UPI003D0003C8